MHALEYTADQVLKRACIDPNPRFELIRSAPKLAKVVNVDYVPTNAKSGLRISMAERVGMRERIAGLKEETGILAYMRRNGLEN